MYIKKCCNDGQAIKMYISKHDFTKHLAVDNGATQTTDNRFIKLLQQHQSLLPMRTS